MHSSLSIKLFGIAAQFTGTKASDRPFAAWAWCASPSLPVPIYGRNSGWLRFRRHWLFCDVRLGRAEGIAMFVLYLLDMETRQFVTFTRSKRPQVAASYNNASAWIVPGTVSAGPTRLLNLARFTLNCAHSRGYTFVCWFATTGKAGNGLSVCFAPARPRLQAVRRGQR